MKEIQELPGITRFVPKLLLALTVTICHEVYKKIAYWLNDMGEGHFSWIGVVFAPWRTDAFVSPPRELQASERLRE